MSKDTNKEIQQEFAKEHFGKDANVKLEQMRQAIQGGGIQKSQAVEDLSAFTYGLMLKVLYQDIRGVNRHPLAELFKSTFFGGYVKNGNGKEYSSILATGVGKYSALGNTFVPDKVINGKAESMTLNMYTVNEQGQKVLGPNAYQLSKSISIQIDLMVAAFVSGKLFDFVEKLIISLQTSIEYVLTDKIATMITTADCPVFTFNQETSWEVWTKAIFPTLQDTTTLSKKFNYANKDNGNVSKTIQAFDPNDWLIFANAETIAQVNVGILSNTYNPTFFNTLGKKFNLDKMINLGKKLVIPDNEEDLITLSNDDYIPKDEIYFVHKKSIAWFGQLEENAEQFFARNLIRQYYIHVWGAVTFLKWGGVFKIKAPNLNTNPTIAP